MDDEQLQRDYQFNMPQQDLPNSGLILGLGIASIVFSCFCIGGIICGIISLVMSGNSMRAYRENPMAYTQSSYSNINAGKICAIIGVSLSVIAVIISIVYYAAIVAVLATGDY